MREANTRFEHGCGDAAVGMEISVDEAGIRGCDRFGGGDEFRYRSVERRTSLGPGCKRFGIRGGADDGDSLEGREHGPSGMRSEERTSIRS